MHARLVLRLTYCLVVCPCSKFQMIISEVGVVKEAHVFHPTDLDRALLASKHMSSICRSLLANTNLANETARELLVSDHYAPGIHCISNHTVCVGFLNVSIKVQSE